MRILRWMSGHTKKNKVWNDCIQEKVRVTPIDDKKTEVRLTWFGYVQKRPPGALVRKDNQMAFNL